MRAAIILMLAAGLLPATDLASPQYLQKLDAFNHAYNRFFRDLMGCPDKATSINDCNPQLGILNQEALKVVREQAPRLFAPTGKSKGLRHAVAGLSVSGAAAGCSSAAGGDR